VPLILKDVYQWRIPESVIQEIADRDTTSTPRP